MTEICNHVLQKRLITVDCSQFVFNDNVLRNISYNRIVTAHSYQLTFTKRGNLTSNIHNRKTCNCVLNFETRHKQNYINISYV